MTLAKKENISKIETRKLYCFMMTASINFSYAEDKVEFIFLSIMEFHFLLKKSIHLFQELNHRKT